MKRLNILVLISILICINFVAASYDIGNLSHSLNTQYAPESFVKGWINISFENEPADSLFSFGNQEISILDLLKLNSNSYSCSPTNCNTSYTASNFETSKTFNLGASTSKIIGLKFTGELDFIESINFSVQSDASSSCVNQLKIDVLADGEIDAGNIHYLNSECSLLKKYGCFDSSEDTKLFSISDSPYCQKIKLTEAAAFKIGAWIKEETAGTKTITAALYNSYGSEIEDAYCELTGISSEGSEVGCNVEYLVSESEDYYVCIYAGGGSGTYKLRGNTEPKAKCGFPEYPVQTGVAAYQIFVIGKKFSNFGTINVNDEISEETMSSKIENYIFQNYGFAGDCDEGCVVPIKFLASVSQTVTISDLKISYKTDQGVEETNKFYDVEEDVSKINLDFEKVYLDKANFSVPEKFGEFDFELNLEGDELISEELYVDKIPTIQSISPTTTGAEVPTTFKVNVESDYNITKYSWDFGDGYSTTSTSNEISHTYNETGTYSLKIEITDTEELTSSKEFNIFVGSPKAIANSTLKKKLENLEDIKSQINNFATFKQQAINSVLEIVNMEEDLKNAQKKFNSAISDDDYAQVMKSLLDIEVPESILTSESSNYLPLLPSEQVIDLDVIEEIGGGSYDDIDAFTNGLYLWNQNNLNSKVKFEEISAAYENYETPIIRMFDLEISETTALNYNYYFIVKKLENIKFYSEPNVLEKAGYNYIEISDSPKTINFYTTEEIDFIELPAFVSPSLNRLPVSSSSSPGADKEIPWVMFSIIILILIVAALGAYVWLQIWYKRKYETYLFKNNNELYNLTRYVDNAKQKGQTNSHIVSNLRKAGWKGEQISYVMKKYSGKRTGMFEIPLDKIIDMFKKKSEQKPNFDKKNQNKFKRKL